MRRGDRRWPHKRIPADYNGLLFDSDTFADLLRDIHAKPEDGPAVVGLDHVDHDLPGPSVEPSGVLVVWEEPALYRRPPLRL